MTTPTIKNRPQTRRCRPGYISLLAVFTLSVFMLTLMLFAYERAINAQSVQSDIQTRTDYREKEETILRSIVAITPNRAIRAMQSGSNISEAARAPLTFRAIFQEALDQSNARRSIDPQLIESLSIPIVFGGNTGDSSLANVERVFRPISGGNGLVTSGTQVESGFPPALNRSPDFANDDVYPIITSSKIYATSALPAYIDERLKLDPLKPANQKFNRIRYPDINFGYGKPGDYFVAKRNWWAFSMDLAGQDAEVTKLDRLRRQFVLSIYEIPSQLPISASSFVALGEHADGKAWENVTISGNIFAGRAKIEGDMALSTLATRRGVELSQNSTIGGQTFNGSPFAPGVRETFRLTEGDFFPISLSSESGKAAFVPINRGKFYFDRFDSELNLNESASISPTTWDSYSIGAMRCVMQLDVTRADAYGSPTRLRFRYLGTDGIRKEIIKDWGGQWTEANMPPLGYVDVGDEDSTVTFSTPHDLAYGKIGSFNYIDNFTGTIRFDNATFGDPRVGVRKRGFARPAGHDESASSPFDFQDLPSGKKCITVSPERIPAFLAKLNASGPAVNHSLVVNVDYQANPTLVKPSYQCPDTDWGVILVNGRNMTAFPKGFSLVTNMRLYFGDDFNSVEALPPDDFVPPPAKYFPPCSIFAPQKRYGTELDPFSVVLSGQVGSVAEENTEKPVRPLDAIGVSDNAMDSKNIEVNLAPITHPAELPPVFMMNWLVLLEEKRAEFD